MSVTHLHFWTSLHVGLLRLRRRDEKRYGGTGFRKAERRRRRREKWCVAWCDIMAPSCQSGARVAEKAETTLILMPWAHNFDVLVSHVSRRGCCGSSTRRDRDPGTESTSTRHEYKYLGLPPSTLGYLGLEHYNRKPPPEQTTFPRLRPHILLLPTLFRSIYD